MNAQLRERSEVSDVVRNDEAGVRGERYLGDHVVLRVWQKRSPQEEDGLVNSDGAEVVENRVKHRSGDARAGARARVLVLENERHRDRDIEFAGPH